MCVDLCPANLLILFIGSGRFLVDPFGFCACHLQVNIVFSFTSLSIWTPIITSLPDCSARSPWDGEGWYPCLLPSLSEDSIPSSYVCELELFCRKNQPFLISHLFMKLLICISMDSWIFLIVDFTAPVVPSLSF